ncbi:hypothetical protein LTR55_012309, partial [Exophiala xenobiotica]
MPTTLLPASAAAFAPRSRCIVVLSAQAAPWLASTLKRTSKIKRSFNTVLQQTRYLTEILSSPNATWSPCSIMVPKAPEADLRRESNPLVEGLFNFHLIHIEAYVVHVDMVLHHELAFKLTQETIDSLIQYHTDFFLVDSAAETCSWAKKEQQLERLRENFVQAVNKYIYSTNVHVLEGMEAEGAGELLCGRNDEVRAAIMR